MFAEHLHIRPWEIGRLSVDEFERAVAYCEWLNEKARG